jgi:hypothetical protein
MDKGIHSTLILLKHLSFSYVVWEVCKDKAILGMRGQS